MPALKIKLYGEKVLRKKATSVEEVTPEIQQLADNMAETMYEANGIGLAAPQIGHSLRMIVADVESDEERGHPIILINPEIIRKSESIYSAEEGCLSIPGIFGTVNRPEKVVVEGLDKNGNKVKVEGEGLLARCLQHEIDHLDGILFIDRISLSEKAMLQGRLKRLQKENKAKKP